MGTATTTMALFALLGGCATAHLGGGGEVQAGCRLEHSSGVYRAVVEPEAATGGEWRLRLGGPGLSVEQGGAFRAAPGERVVLSEAAVGRTVPEAALTLEVGGRTVACPTVR